MFQCSEIQLNQITFWILPVSTIYLIHTYKNHVITVHINSQISLASFSKFVLGQNKWAPKYEDVVWLTVAVSVGHCSRCENIIIIMMYKSEHADAVVTCYSWCGRPAAAVSLKSLRPALQQTCSGYYIYNTKRHRYNIVTTYLCAYVCIIYRTSDLSSRILIGYRSLGTTYTYS